MRIAVDARELQGQPTGVGRYLAEILAAWDALPSAADHEVILCAPAALNSPPPRRLKVSSVAATGKGTLWEQRVLPRLVRATKADVLFAPGYTGPLRCPVPMVVTIHDVSFAAHPEWFRWKEGLRRRTLTRLAAKRASCVLTISEFSKREIVEHLGIAASAIEVIYPGATTLEGSRAQHGANRGESPASDRAREPLVLFVGSLFNRRHVPELIDGFARLARRRTDMRLEIVGDNRTVPRINIAGHVRATGLADRIGLNAYATDEALASLYGRASAFLYLSEYEGFGLTPLEALAAGVPIVVLSTPVAHEIYGSAAVYADRPDPAVVETALQQAMFDVAERERVLTAARDVLSRYSWRQCAERVLQALEQAARR